MKNKPYLILEDSGRTLEFYRNSDDNVYMSQHDTSTGFTQRVNIGDPVKFIDTLYSMGYTKK